MSKTKFVRYANQGFWAYDVGLGVSLKHLIDAAEAIDQVDAAWLSSAILSWREVACIPDYGLTINADRAPEQRETFVALAEGACSTLACRESIPAEEMIAWPLLEGQGIDSRGAKEVFTAPVVELGRAIIALVSGDLPEAPSGQHWIFGTRTGRETIGKPKF